jgi:hypothetical protein
MSGDPVGVRVERMMRLPRAARYVRRVAAACEPGAFAMDIGCGANSALPAMAPQLRFIGIDNDSQSLDAARESSNYAVLIDADIRDTQRIDAALAGRRPQLICLLHVIEHLPRRDGFELLEWAEAATSRFVLLETPNRFQPQGPEYGNQAQRHLSGWFPHDFEALGYTVRGTAGTRYLRGYAGGLRLPFRGGNSMDSVLARLLMIEVATRHAYALAAWKDVRGVPSRL